MDSQMLVERFLIWMRDGDAAERMRAANLLVRLHNDSRLTDVDRDSIEAGLTYLIDDPDPTVRVALARAVAGCETLPHHIPLALANDVPQVAVEIAGRCAALTESDLVDLVGLHPEEVQRAIADRAEVSVAVSAALAEVGAGQAVVELLLNRRAEILDQTYHRILDRFGDWTFVRRAMEARDGLVATVRQALGRLDLAARHRDEAATPMGERDFREDVDRHTVSLAEGLSPAETRDYVAYLKASAQLTTALILRSAVAGQVSFVAAALASLAQMPPERVVPAVMKADAGMIEAVARKGGIPARSVPALLAAVELAREQAQESQCDEEYVRIREATERLIERYVALGGDAADDITLSLRRYAGDAARQAARRRMERAFVLPGLAAVRAPALTAPPVIIDQGACDSDAGPVMVDHPVTVPAADTTQVAHVLADEIVAAKFTAMPAAVEAKPHTVAAAAFASLPEPTLPSPMVAAVAEPAAAADVVPSDPSLEEMLARLDAIVAEVMPPPRLPRLDAAEAELAARTVTDSLRQVPFALSGDDLFAPPVADEPDVILPVLSLPPLELPPATPRRVDAMAVQDITPGLFTPAEAVRDAGEPPDPLPLPMALIENAPGPLGSRAAADVAAAHARPMAPVEVVVSPSVPPVVTLAEMPVAPVPARAMSTRADFEPLSEPSFETEALSAIFQRLKAVADQGLSPRCSDAARGFSRAA